MIPLLFPSTCVSSAMMDLLAALFPKVAVYQPGAESVPPELTDLVSRGLLEIRTPVAGDEQRLRSAIAEYQAFARMHEGEDLACFMTRQGQVPFFDDQSVDAIRDQLRKRVDGRAAETAPAADPLMEARLFLAMAQEFDRQQWALEEDLSRFADMEASLIKELQGDEETAAELGAARMTGAPDPTAHLAERRLTAWMRLATQDPDPARVWVACGRNAYETLLDRLPPPALARELGVFRIPADPEERVRWQAALDGFLSAMPDGDAESLRFPDAGNDSTLVRLTVAMAGWAVLRRFPERPRRLPEPSKHETRVVLLLTERG